MIKNLINNKMEKKNYYWILLALLVLLLGSFWYYQNYIKVEDQNDQEPSNNSEQISENNSQEIDLNEVEDFGNAYLNNGDNFATSTDIEDISYEVFLPGVWKSMDADINEIKMTEDGKVEYVSNDSTLSGSWRTEGYHLIIEALGLERTFTVMFVGAQKMELKDLETGQTLNFVRVIK